jgi:hypothetical protein
MTDIVWNQKARESTALGRFEVMCELYNNGGEEVRNTILRFLPDEEKETFLKGCGLYHLFTDPAFYNATKNAMAETLYKEFTKK